MKIRRIWIFVNSLFSEYMKSQMCCLIIFVENQLTLNNFLYWTLISHRIFPSVFKTFRIVNGGKNKCLVENELKAKEIKLVWNLQNYGKMSMVLKDEWREGASGWSIELIVRPLVSTRVWSQGWERKLHFGLSTPPRVGLCFSLPLPLPLPYSLTVSLPPLSLSLSSK